MTNTRDRQISIRISADLDAWLRAKAAGNGKAELVRTIIEEARRRDEQAALRSQFDRAAVEFDERDRRELEQLTSAAADDLAARTDDELAS